MAAIAASSAKRSLRTELKQRLRALSAEERLRQSHLLTQKVREGCEELNAWKLGLGWHVCAGAPLPPLCVRVLVGARSRLQAGPVAFPADPVGSAQLFRAGRQARLFIQAELFCCGGYALPRALVDVENVEPRLQISV